jgi:hypothetical protein
MTGKATHASKDVLCPRRPSSSIEDVSDRDFVEKNHGDIAFPRRLCSHAEAKARRSKRSSTETDWQPIGQGKSKAMTSHRTPKHEPPMECSDLSEHWFCAGAADQRKVL